MIIYQFPMYLNSRSQTIHLGWFNESEYQTNPMSTISTHTMLNPSLFSFYIKNQIVGLTQTLLVFYQFNKTQSTLQQKKNSNSKDLNLHTQAKSAKNNQNFIWSKHKHLDLQLYIHSSPKKKNDFISWYISYHQERISYTTKWKILNFGTSN